jgi:hypothetical protein
MKPGVHTSEERSAWREGFQAGLKAGTTRTLQSPTLENLFLELTLLRLVCDAMTQAASEQQAELDRLREWHDDCEVFHGRLKAEGRW